jgi:hypothetical protein
MGKKQIVVNFEITKLKTSIFLTFILVLFTPFWLGSETQIVSTYYPAPHGTLEKLFGGFLKAGAIDNFVEIGRGSRTIGGSSLTDVDYIYSNTQLYVRSATGTINFSPASETVTFLADTASYSPYVSSFCSWAANCPVGYLPLVRGVAVGQIAYGSNIPPIKLCCRMTIN